MSKTTLIRLFLFVVIPLGLLGWAGHRYFQGPEELPPPQGPINYLGEKWAEQLAKVEDARKEYKAGLDAKRAKKKDEAIPHIETAVARLDEAIQGGQAIIDENRKALIDQGKSTAEADGAAETYRVEVERWRAEYNDAKGLLGSLKGTTPTEGDGTGG